MKPMSPEERAARVKRGEQLRAAFMRYGQALKGLGEQLERETDSLEVLVGGMLLTDVLPDVYARDGQLALQRWTASTQQSVSAERNADAARLALLEVMTETATKDPRHG